MVLSQQDPKWAEKLIGSSSMTIGRWGCTLTCISMITEEAGAWLRPDEIASHTDWFTDRNHPRGPGLIVWDNLKLPGVKFEERIYEHDDIAIRKAIADPKRFVMLEVNKVHWVLATKKNFTGSYQIKDPWTGTKVNSNRYKTITGAAFFTLT